MRLRFAGVPVRRTLWRLMVIGVALAFAACSMLHQGKPASAGASAEPSAESSAEASPSAEGTPAENAAPEGSAAESASPESSPTETAPAEGGSNDANSAPPGATVAITYAHQGDYLYSLSVSKFNGAEMVESRSVDPEHVTSIIRFDGGVTVWEIKADTGVLSKLPVVGSGERFAAKSVTYGKLPAHFAQVTPDGDPPESLEVGHYYIFTAQRASGTLSYEAVRVAADGSLDGYEAEPRAGTSYLLCCNVSPDFVQPTAPAIPEGTGPGPGP
ncbi:MAG TPA: hypothetical protein VNF49_13365 [Candidatus Binataceae bacterium]|nr:hypothetical protein [Candidatus Binataceae bacterium]